MTGRAHTPQTLASLRRAGSAALDLLLPPQCLGCRLVVDAPGSLCPSCWEGVAFVAPPLCVLCGLPFEFDAGPEAVCGACLREPPAFDHARAVMRYDGGSRDLILGFKHGDRTHGAGAFGAWMARAGAELLADVDLVVPVPLHWTRLFARRYNQSALLAAAMARRCGLPVVPDLLRRTRRTPSQGRLSPAARAKNLRGAIAVNRRQATRVPGQRIVLVDDVLTSGATANACARGLKRAGAVTVDVLILARAVSPAATRL